MLKALAGKVAIDYTSLEADPEENVSKDVSNGDGVLTSAGIKGSRDEDLSVYGKAFAAFGGGQTGKEACMALAALCEVASINTLISNFIEPLQVVFRSEAINERNAVKCVCAMLVSLLFQ